jgi:peptidoglycan/LPS O-acetylase OafA/YrhL
MDPEESGSSAKVASGVHPSAPTPVRDIRAHTGLRGIPAVVVFLGHVGFDRFWPALPWFGWIYGFFYWHGPAVDRFFILSGFILLRFSDLYFLLPPLFACMVAVTFLETSALARFFGSPFLNYLGGLSYSIYIWQWPVLKACALMFGVRQMGSAETNIHAPLSHRLLFTFGTPLVLAIVVNLSYYKFETPLRGLIRKVFRKRKISAAAQLPAAELAKSPSVLGD